MSDEELATEAEEDAASVGIPWWILLIREIRKLLVPIITAIIAGAAAGGGASMWGHEARQGETLRNARRAAEEEVLRLEQIRDRLKAEIRARATAYLSAKGSWEEIHAFLEKDGDELTARVHAELVAASIPMTPAVEVDGPVAGLVGGRVDLPEPPPPPSREWVQQAVRSEISNLAAQHAAPR